MIKYIIFDFDGTIANSRNLAIDLYNELAEKYGYGKIETKEVQYLSTLTIKERLGALQVPFYKLPGLVMEMKHNYKESINSLKANDGIQALIHDLKNEGYQLCIISSNSNAIIDNFLANNNVNGFDHVYCTRNLFGKHVLIDRFLKKHNIQKQDVIYVGDEFRDIEACKKSKVKIISVTWGYDSEELLSKGDPDYVIHHPKELLHLMQQLKVGGELSGVHIPDFTDNGSDSVF